MNAAEQKSNEMGEAFSILVVDDNEMNRDLLLRRLGNAEFQLSSAMDGEEALAKLRAHSFDLVLLDIMMPVLDGYETLKVIQGDAVLRRVPVIMITALDDVDSAVRCIEMGAVDYVTKPFNPILLRARVDANLGRKRISDQEEHRREEIERNNVSLSEEVRAKVLEISQSQLAAIFAMSKLAESRDPETGEHLERMREYCKLLSEKLGRMPKFQSIIDKAFIDNIYAASPLHDIGKVGIDDSVLLKPGALSDEEWAIMKQHPVIGAETLREVDRQHPGNDFIHTGIEIAESHHEKWDGSGYPYGLSGKSIPLVARILALGDVYDALTSRRCYKDAFSHEKSRGIIEEGHGSHFDPDVVSAFFEAEDDFKRVRQEYRDPEQS
ncbi:MAG: response regulator [Gammaproteobacteria bacterium]|nr:response regulator [Gammaproteobacteria bacterium]MCF6258716.1 response regulator [Gammaproteobacteria bacterium]